MPPQGTSTVVWTLAVGGRALAEARAVFEACLGALEAAATFAEDFVAQIALRPAVAGARSLAGEEEDPRRSQYRHQTKPTDHVSSIYRSGSGSREKLKAEVYRLDRIL